MPGNSSGSHDHADHRELLGRIDERTKVILDALDKFVTKDEFRTVRDNYVTQQEHKPIRLLVYGGVGLMCTMVLTALLATVFRNTSEASDDRTHASPPRIVSGPEPGGPGLGGGDRGGLAAHR